MRLFDQVMIVHAENELNFSTTALRLGARAGSDFLSSITAALSVLRGHRHGGAAAGVMAFLESVSTEVDMAGVVRSHCESRRRIPGFGHLIFRGGDPRAILLKSLLSSFVALHPERRNIFDCAQRVEEEVFRQKKLKPNVDFYAGVIYACLCIPQSWATALFAISRLMGWVAHFDEELRHSSPQKSIRETGHKKGDDH